MIYVHQITCLQILKSISINFNSLVGQTFLELVQLFQREALALLKERGCLFQILFEIGGWRDWDLVRFLGNRGYSWFENDCWGFVSLKKIYGVDRGSNLHINFGSSTGVIRSTHDVWEILSSPVIKGIVWMTEWCIWVILRHLLFNHNIFCLRDNNISFPEDNFCSGSRNHRSLRDPLRRVKIIQTII
jgi:hypothetical protein